jgi:SAM-dependent methyltransferase
MRNEIKQRVPRRLRDAFRRGRYLWFDALDTRDKLLGKSDPLSPPRRMVEEVGGGYEQTGQHFMQIFRDLADLKPKERVLEIGCGVGRIALPLATYLEPPGAYDGLDVVAAPVRWCQQHITPRYPAFRFAHADIYNTSYNPAGRVRASDYAFPYPDGTFDFVFLTSVFTHMLPKDMQNYLGQCARVMKPHARCLITFFLINEEILGLLRSGKSMLDFPNVYANYRTAFKDNPEAVLAYDEPFIRDCYLASGLEITDVRYGAWSGRANGMSGQDIIVARRRQKESGV